MARIHLTLKLDMSLHHGELAAAIIMLVVRVATALASQKVSGLDKVLSLVKRDFRWCAGCPIDGGAVNAMTVNNTQHLDQFVRHSVHSSAWTQSNVTFKRKL